MFEYKAEVVRVIDGDTLTANIDLGFRLWLNNQTVRLHGIDAPTVHSRDKEEVKFGMLSKTFVEKFCADCEGKIVIQTAIENVVFRKEKFGRILAIIKNPKTGEVLNEELVKNYFAVRYDGQNKDDVVPNHLENRKRLLEFTGEFN